MAWGRNGLYPSVLAYIAGLNVIMVAAAAVLHELGHAIYGRISGCTNIEVSLFASFEQSGYAAMHCPDAPSTAGILLSAFILILPLSVLFLALHRVKEQYMGFILFGIGVVLAGADLYMLLGSRVAAGLLVVAGGVVAAHGEYRLIDGIITTEIVRTADMGGDTGKPT